MTWADTVNGVYEMGGAVALAWNCWTTYKDKEIKGLSIASMIFFTSWGYWNLYYYPSLNQWVSTVGAAALVFFNTIWLAQAIYYTRRNRQMGSTTYEKKYAEAVRDMNALDGCWEKKLEVAERKIRELQTKP